MTLGCEIKFSIRQLITRIEGVLRDVTSRLESKMIANCALHVRPLVGDIIQICDRTLEIPNLKSLKFLMFIPDFILLPYCVMWDKHGKVHPSLNLVHLMVK